MTTRLLWLGILQGLTEFLPVSSSGHLSIVQNLWRFESPPLGFDLTLHGATLLATLLFFRKAWWTVLAEWVCGWGKPRGERGQGWKTGWAILAGTLVTAVLGLPLKTAVESAMSSLRIVGALLLVNAGILFTANRLAERAGHRAVSLPVGLGVGLAQGMAVFPGISRSGSTISSGLYLGLSPKEAFDFSFLMSLPAIAGAILLETVEVGGAAAFLSSLPRGWWIGAMAAFLSGLCALSVLRRFVVRGKWGVFAVYSAIAGLGALLAGFAGRG